MLGLFGRYLSKESLPLQLEFPLHLRPPRSFLSLQLDHLSAIFWTLWQLHKEVLCLFYLAWEKFFLAFQRGLAMFGALFLRYTRRQRLRVRPLPLPWTQEPALRKLLVALLPRILSLLPLARRPLLRLALLLHRWEAELLRLLRELT